jgi:hypothetical protein
MSSNKENIPFTNPENLTVCEIIKKIKYLERSIRYQFYHTTNRKERIKLLKSYLHS